jgi:hypothetical protein
MAVPARAKDKTADQLAVLSKYSSRIAKIDQPYVMGASVNRKGPSSYANAKDKSDRATSEQVLDPRTRIILFKMIGRELIQEVNGCVSTGKEVRPSGFILTFLPASLRVFRQMFIMLSPPPQRILPSKYTRHPSLYSRTAIVM